MKTGLLSVAALSLLQLVAAQPHARRHIHPRGKVPEQDVYIYVNQFGSTLSVVTSTIPADVATPPPAAATPAPAPTTSSSSSSAPVPAAFYASSSSSAATTASAVSSAKPSPSASASASSGSSSGGSGGGGITYSPLNAGGQCKSSGEINSDMAGMSGYGIVRIYDTSCLQDVFTAAKTNGKKLFAGINIDAGTINNWQTDADALAAVFKQDWSIVDTIAVGNEVVQRGGDPGSLASAVKSAKSHLSGLGYSGSVVTVDTVWNILANPVLCQSSDYVAGNCHPFFDPHATAEGAGDFVKTQAAPLSAACGGKRVVITETGWPWNGQSHDNAQVSVQAQTAAISSLKAAFPDPTSLFLFSSYDELWKVDNAGTHGAEKFWGFLSHATS